MSLFFETPAFLAVQARVSWLATANGSTRAKVSWLLDHGKTVDWVVMVLGGFKEGDDFGPGSHSTGGENKLTELIYQVLGRRLGGGTGGDPVGNPTDPEVPSEFAVEYDATKAFARLTRFMVTYAGTKLDPETFAARAARLSTSGVPPAWQDREYRFTAYAFLSGAFNPFPNAFGSGEAPPDHLTLQSWLDEQRLLAGYGPSGGGAPATSVLGPGGND